MRLFNVNDPVFRPVNYCVELYESWTESESNDFCLIHESNRISLFKSHLIIQIESNHFI